MFRFRFDSWRGYKVYSSVAQLAVRSAVNRKAVGSSPTGGADLIFDKLIWEL